MKKILAGTVAIVFLIVSCDKKQVQDSSLTENIAISDSLSGNMKNTSDISGTYYGEISCDDCESAELTLKENNSYSLILQLSSEEKTPDNVVTTEGKYSWNQEKTIISLDKYNLHFKVDNGKLFYLDHSFSVDENEVLIKK